jgi:NAD(P)-dependent dehydrogenase (short-subunit alcohol dehydrogenase family)
MAHLLQHNPEKIYMLSMKEEHADEAQKDLEEWGDTSKVEWRQVNFESFDQTDKVARGLAKDLDRLDGLICNAGLGVGVYNQTGDGIESKMQVNVFSQAHLALTLLPVLQKTPDSRLVFQSSDLHRAAPSSIAFKTIQEMNEDIGASYLYNRSKLAQILFARELVKRIKANQFGPVSAKKGEPWINCSHPGAVSTDQQKQAEDAYGILGTIGVAATRPFMKDPVKQGCRPILFAATSPDVVKEKIQGQYIVPDRKPTAPSTQAQDEGLAASLWNLTKEVLESKISNLPYAM